MHARQCISDDLSFVGALGSREGSDVYVSDMQRIRIKYDAKQVLVDRADVCLICDFTLAGVTVFGAGWYHVAGGRIGSLRVVFDPRPILEATRH